MNVPTRPGKFCKIVQLPKSGEARKKFWRAGESEKVSSVTSGAGLVIRVNFGGIIAGFW